VTCNHWRLLHQWLRVK